jgi:hypothetical protein
MSLESGQLLLRQDTTVTCPKCADDFSLDQGFAKKALGQLSEASAGAIAAMREAERAQVERRAGEGSEGGDCGEDTECIVRPREPIWVAGGLCSQAAGARGRGCYSR